MRRGFLITELVVGMGVIALILGGAVAFFATLVQRNIEVRRNAAVVQALANAVEQLRADPSLAPPAGTEAPWELPAVTARAYPHLSLRVEAHEVPDDARLRLIRIVATLRRETSAPKETAVEILIPARSTEEGM